MKNDCTGLEKLSRFDFNITDTDFEDLQAGCQHVMPSFYML